MGGGRVGGQWRKWVVTGEIWRAGGSRVSGVVGGQGDQQWGKILCRVMSCRLCSSAQGQMHKVLQMMRMLSTKAVDAQTYPSRTLSVHL